MKIQKRYILLGIVMIGVTLLIWRISSSYAGMNLGYEGNNIVSGDKWGVNIVEISEVETSGQALVVGDISTMGTIFNFNPVLFKPGDEVSFDLVVENTSSLKAELYALTLCGLSKSDGENINYRIIPIDSSIIHTETSDGSIIKSGERQRFRVTLSYDEKTNDMKEYSLNLGGNIVYKQK